MMSEDLVIKLDEDTGSIAKLEQQIELAQRIPRNWDDIVSQVKRRGSTNKETAALCFYTLKKGGTSIEGPGVRFAELIFASMNHMQIGQRIVEIGEREITAECVIYDMQTNKQFTIRETKAIVTKEGKRFSNDMVITTGRAAAAVAKRNCIFAAVPMIEFEGTLRELKKIGTGASPSRDDSKVLPLEERRANALQYFNKLGIDGDRVLFTLQLSHVDEIGEDELVTLLGIRTAIKDGVSTLEESFPDPKKGVKKRGKDAADSLFDK